MTHVIFKFPLAAQHRQALYIPAGHKLLHAHEQHGVVCLWALCPQPSDTRTRVQVTCCSTGAPIPEDAGDYLGTAHLHGGNLIIHVFTKEIAP